MGCFHLPGAAAVIAGGEACKNTTLPTQNKNWPSDKRPGHAFTEYKSFSPEEIRHRMRQSKGAVFFFPHFAQLAPILLLSKKKKGNNKSGWSSTRAKYMELFRLNPVKY